MPRPVWTTSVATLGDYIRQLREKLDEPYKSDKSGEPCKSCQSDKPDCDGSQHANGEYHECPRCPARTCNCTWKCAEREFDEYGYEADPAKSDNTDNSTFSNGVKERRRAGGSTTEGQNFGGWPWPCVIPGAFIQAGFDAIQCFSGSNNKSVDTKRTEHKSRHIDGATGNPADKAK